MIRRSKVSCSQATNTRETELTPRYLPRLVQEAVFDRRRGCSAGCVGHRWARGIQVHNLPFAFRLHCAPTFSRGRERETGHSLARTRHSSLFRYDTDHLAFFDVQRDAGTVHAVRRRFHARLLDLRPELFHGNGSILPSDPASEGPRLCATRASGQQTRFGGLGSDGQHRWCVNAFCSVSAEY